MWEGIKPRWDSGTSGWMGARPGKELITKLKTFGSSVDLSDFLPSLIYKELPPVTFIKLKGLFDCHGHLGCEHVKAGSKLRAPVTLLTCSSTLLFLLISSCHRYYLKNSSWRFGCCFHFIMSKESWPRKTTLEHAVIFWKCTSESIMSFDPLGFVNWDMSGCSNILAPPVNNTSFDLIYFLMEIS